MDEKVYFRLSYETMTGDTEDFINACLERANRADCNDTDAEIAPDDVADRDHLRFTEMLLRAPTAEQRACQL
ncbi:hypothetical protein [Escherichia coli]|uniref:hypothetical protein n=1 Tax=Escherichia coli TaxID=562 RepID=UPI000E681039|nr:hypothetical protein [Escherichia coli]EHY3328738.1 hypothetical protein [Escherichia coli]RIW40556.1 hypothetical protein D3H36_25320 [Escherichia coli]